MTALRTHTVIDTPIGELTLVNTDGVLSGVYMAEHHPRPTAPVSASRSPRGSTK